MADFVYKRVEIRTLAHSQSNLGDLVTAAVLGDNIEAMLEDRTSPLTMLLEKARDDFLAAHTTLLEADLNTRDGLEQAKRLQRDALYYSTLCRYLAESMEERDRAIEAAASQDLEEPGAELLKDQIYGSRRAKPAFDS